MSGRLPQKNIQKKRLFLWYNNGGQKAGLNNASVDWKNMIDFIFKQPFTVYCTPGTESC